MANAGKTVATLLIGAAVGAAVGYIVATDDKKRKEDFDSIKNQLNDWADQAKNKANDMAGEIKSKLNKTTEDIEKEIYNA